MTTADWPMISAVLLGDKCTSPEQWAVKRVDLLVELLHKMAQVLDYDFYKTHIKNSSYSPVAHGNIEDEQKGVRTGLIQILEGKRPIAMTVVNWPQNQ